MTPFDCKFDLVFSVGEDCSAAMHLRQAGLRDCSSPFDWICHASFMTPFELLARGLSGFLTKESLRWFPKPASGLKDAKTENYEDLSTGYYFHHDFPAGQALDDSYPSVKEKYDRRIRRIVERLSQSGNVLMVWWSRDKRIGDDEACKAVATVQAAYPAAQIYLLLFENDLSIKPGRVFKRRVSDRIIRVTGGLCPNLEETAGYRPATQKVLKQIKTTYPRQRTEHSFQRAMVRFFSLFHLTRDARKVARKRWSERLGA